MEIWKKYYDYDVSNHGRIKRGQRELTGTITKKGYVRVKIKGRATMLHRIVAYSFIGKQKEGFQINHKNGIKTDNRVENLEWVTPSENLKHSYEKLGRKAAFEGKSLPKWIRKKISESNKGRIITEEWRRRNSESHKGKYKGSENPHALAIFCIETGKRYGSVKDAADELGLNLMSLYNAIRNNKKYKNQTFIKEK